MPCNCDHLEPTAREKHRKEAAELLVWVQKKVGGSVEPWLEKAASDIYGGGDDRPVQALCARLNSMSIMSPKVFDSLVYNAKDRASRRLADWWEDHCEHDRNRNK